MELPPVPACAPGAPGAPGAGSDARGSGAGAQRPLAAPVRSPSRRGAARCGLSCPRPGPVPRRASRRLPSRFAFGQPPFPGGFVQLGRAAAAGAEPACVTLSRAQR